MSDKKHIYYATDKEIYDVLMSSKQRITESILLEIAKDRGILYSPLDARETLARSISCLLHDYYDLTYILDQRGQSNRVEKSTSIILKAKLTIDDLREVSDEYKEHVQSEETIINNQHGPNKYNLLVKYSELDYSKTRLVQRREKEANIEFIIQDDQVIVRMPANEKAKEVVNNIKNRLDSIIKTDIPTDKIELTGLQSSLERTEFFTTLISNLPGFSLYDVTSVKVDSGIKEEDYDDLDIDDEYDDDQEAEQSEHEKLALAMVKNVALKGKSLLTSAEYQQLKGKGFYITSITWRSKKISTTSPIVEFEANFDEPEVGKGFKYGIHGALHFKKNEYTKHIRPISTDERQQYLALIEGAAQKTLADLREKAFTNDNMSEMP